jgi:hypothetical protein
LGRRGQRPSRSVDDSAEARTLKLFMGAGDHRAHRRRISSRCCRCRSLRSVPSNDHQPMERHRKFDTDQTRNLQQPWSYERIANASRCGTAPRSRTRFYIKPETTSHSKFRRRSRLPRLNCHCHCQVGPVYANCKVPPNSIAILIFFPYRLGFRTD